MHPNYMSPMMNPQVPEPPPCPDGTIYTIRPGDTMFRIANRYDISLTQLIAANPQITNPNIIFVGQRICIPKVVTPLPPPEEFCPDGILYTVQRGDTMFNIARRYGLTLQQLIRANPQIPDPNVLEIGQKICIPVTGVPLPEGICKIDLKPERTGILGATAFINIPDPTVWISTFGLPDPATIDTKYKCYYAWVVDRDTEKYCRVDLKDSGVPDIMVGYRKTTGSFVGYDEIIVTAEAVVSISKPEGPVLLRGSLAPCR
ncbi:LysM peptidoglycan-binding domain-containing protein [Natronincola ferrireducens]|uniref:Spore coat assembly protein SafA n=1 Tax=Natronincola ferrireducens TaxID=393762 RepID=A0A1G8YZ76_9FIRM|nr:LysM peptidoglycan-binding domain-containing protein [Natronincola ferrireducens]SDK08189.1 spore coat assembly protein SafA [Natronincola ferrireducens]